MKAEKLRSVQGNSNRAKTNRSNETVVSLSLSVDFWSRRAARIPGTKKIIDGLHKLPNAMQQPTRIALVTLDRTFSSRARARVVKTRLIDSVMVVMLNRTNGGYMTAMEAAINPALGLKSRRAIV